MNDVKVNLNLVLQGRTLLSHEQAEAFEKEKSGTGYDTFRLDVEETKVNGNKKVTKKETIFPKVRKTKTIKQTINLSKEAYDYMTSTDDRDCPWFFKPKQWRAMNSKMKLEAHLERIAQHLGAQSFTYNVLED